MSDENNPFAGQSEEAASNTAEDTNPFATESSAEADPWGNSE